jgi:hypothetical protein
MVNRLLPLLLLGLLWASNAVAQNVPQGFNYQCIVRDNTGASINNQTVTLLFTIRNNAPNGPIAYSEMQTTSTNTFGLINLTIGGGTPLQGNFANINWGASPKFLTVSVETAPGVFDEVGTSQLLSVPYALYSLNAANGADNWGTQTVQTTPVLSGNGTTANPLTLAQQGAQTGQVLKWNGSTWVPQNDNTGQNGTVTEVNTGAGLTGGPITITGTISLANAPVTPGAYGGPNDIPVITVDQYGRVVNATTVPVILTTINAGAGINVAKNGQVFTITNIGDVDPSDDLTTSSIADGEITGPFSNLQIKPGVVSTPKLADGAVTTPKIADGAVNTAKLADGAVNTAKLADNAVNTSKIANGAVTGAKINDMGASNGQVLKWNGTTWAPAQDATGPTVGLNAGAGISISGAFPNFTITNTGDTNPNDDITTSSIADGEITGTFTNLQIKAGVVNAFKLADNAVTSPKINTHAVTGNKIDPMGAMMGQVLKWNGTTWAPAPDNVGVVTINGGSGIDVVAVGQNFTISNTGDVNPFDDITINSIADGDVTGPFSNLQLKASVVGSVELANNAVQTSKIQDGAVTGAKIAQGGANNGQVLKWNGTTWAPANDLGPDNWGTQTVVVTTRLMGNGTSTSPLDLAQNNATFGQVLKWNGSVWAPADDVGGNYAAGPGISITGSAPNFIISNTGDNDNDPTNEIQTLSLSGNNLTLSKGGGTVTLPSGNNYAAGPGISITGSAPNFTINNTGDTDPTDDITTASVAGGDVTGPFSNLQIVAGAVGTPELANGAVTGTKISQMGANVDEVLRWDGTTWVPSILPLYKSLNLAGNGTSSDPLRLNNFGASDGQVLKWNSVANLWLPANDSVGVQAVQTDGTLAGDGTAGNPLKIAQQGAQTGQVLKWDGATWTPADDDVATPGGGDNWGTQTVVSDNTLAGNGTTLAPLRIAQQGANPGQVLKWNGTTWAPANEAAGNNYAAGPGISITGSAPNFTINNTGDTNPADDITTASIAGGDVTGPFSNLQIVAGAVGTPELANSAVTGAKIAPMGATPGQVLKWNGSTWAPASDNTGNNYTAGPGISITGSAPNFTINNTGDNDNDPTNEIQTLSLSGNDLTLSNGGGTVNLPIHNYTAGPGISITGTAPNFTINNTGDNDADPTNELQTLSLNGTELSISGTGSVVNFDTLFNNAGIGLWTASGTNIYNANTGNVGVGTTTPATRLHVKSNADALRIEGTVEAGLSFATGASPSAYVGKATGALSIETKDSSSIILATGGGKSVFVGGLTGFVGLGNLSHPSARLRVSHATGFGGLMIENSNSGGQWDFRVNPMTGALELYNNFSGFASPVGTFLTNGAYIPSDKRLKKDIQSAGRVLDRISLLQPVYYRYRHESADAKRSVGFLAQDVEALFPELVTQNPMPDGNVYLGLNYAGFSVLAIKAIQEQQEEIQALRQKNEQLEKRLNALEARLLQGEQTRASSEK